MKIFPDQVPFKKIYSKSGAFKNIILESQYKQEHWKDINRYFLWHFYYNIFCGTWNTIDFDRHFLYVALYNTTNSYTELYCTNVHNTSQSNNALHCTLLYSTVNYQSLQQVSTMLYSTTQLQSKFYRNAQYSTIVHTICRNTILHTTPELYTTLKYTAKLFQCLSQLPTQIQ